jgi:hypothetical protein
MPTSIDVVSQGWWGLADADSFYPDDLPQEWQLTYFANVFPAVLVPGPLWQQRSESELADWHADVHAGFRFYLELTSSTDDRARSRATAALGPALIAFVAEAPEPRGAEQVADQARALIAPHTGHRIGAARHCPCHLNDNPRSARRWLDAQAEPPRPEPLGLVILDRPRLTELEAWQNLLMLLGRSWR